MNAAIQLVPNRSKSKSKPIQKKTKIQTSSLLGKKRKQKPQKTQNTPINSRQETVSHYFINKRQHIASSTLPLPLPLPLSLPVEIISC